MAHPTKSEFAAALRTIADNMDSDLDMPDDPDAVSALGRDGVMGELAGWLLREMYDWGWYQGYTEGAGAPPVTVTKRKLGASERVQTTLFGEVTP